MPAAVSPLRLLPLLPFSWAHSRNHAQQDLMPAVSNDLSEVARELTATGLCSTVFWRFKGKSAELSVLRWERGFWSRPIWS